MADGPSTIPKRSLFKKPNWAAKSASVPDTDRPFFDHRETTYGAILAEKEKKREKHRAKPSKEPKEGHGRETKRPRMSESDDSDSALDSSRHADSEEDTHAQAESNDRPVTRSTPIKKREFSGSVSEPCPAKSFSPLKPCNSTRATIIDLNDEDDLEDTRPSPGKSKNVSPIKPLPKHPTSDPDSEDEDGYTLELKRKAREKARLRKLGLEPTQLMTPEPVTAKSQSPQLASAARAGSILSIGEATFSNSPPPPDKPKKEDDIVVRILISTGIPNTKPLIVNRRATQNFQQVKEAWCKRQGFDAATTRKVILTWRGTKLFNTTTCTGILRTLKGEIRKSGGAGLDSEDDDADPSKGNIEVEAVTEDILAERKLAREKEERVLSLGKGDEEPPDEGSGEPEVPKEPEYQLQLKCPGIEQVHLKVRASTLVSKVMAGFQKIRRVDKEKTCWLSFDGERLDPEKTIGDTEIEDGDVVDVQIR